VLLIKSLDASGVPAAEGDRQAFHRHPVGLLRFRLQDPVGSQQSLLGASQSRVGYTAPRAPQARGAPVGRLRSQPLAQRFLVGGGGRQSAPAEIVVEGPDDLERMTVGEEICQAPKSLSGLALFD